MYDDLLEGYSEKDKKKIIRFAVRAAMGILLIVGLIFLYLGFLFLGYKPPVVGVIGLGLGLFFITMASAK